jgi:hypothetical protein
MMNLIPSFLGGGSAPAPEEDPNASLVDETAATDPTDTSLVPAPEVPPQVDSANARIAEQLGLTAGTIDRYGDALGIRPAGVKDAIRDFTIGFLSGDPSRATTQKDAIRTQFFGQKLRAQQAALAHQREQRAATTAFLTNLKSIHDPTVPPSIRSTLMKRVVADLGVEMPPEIQKYLVDQKTFNDGALAWFQEQLTSGALDLPGMDKLAPLFTDVGQAMGVVNALNDAYQKALNRKKTIGEIANGQVDNEAKRFGLAQSTDNAPYQGLEALPMMIEREIDARQKGTTMYEQFGAISTNKLIKAGQMYMRRKAMGDPDQGNGLAELLRELLGGTPGAPPPAPGGAPPPGTSVNLPGGGRGSVTPPTPSAVLPDAPPTPNTSMNSFDTSGAGMGYRMPDSFVAGPEEPDLPFGLGLQQKYRP